jgi:hypothetical protein
MLYSFELLLVLLSSLFPATSTSTTTPRLLSFPLLYVCQAATALFFWASSTCSIFLQAAVAFLKKNYPLLSSLLPMMKLSTSIH